MKLHLLPVLICITGLTFTITSCDINSILRDLNIQFNVAHVQDIPLYQVQPFGKRQRLRNHYNARTNDNVQIIVMHYTHSNCKDTLDTFTSKKRRNRVSAHYVVAQDGSIVQVVPEEKRAWHAGKSYWKGNTDINDISIGIEIVNTGFITTEDGIQWFPFNERQIRSVGTLCKDIINRYYIHPTNVVGHADIAPSRKVDPGILFPWDKLYDTYCVGAWLESADLNNIKRLYDQNISLPGQLDISYTLRNLRQYGYDVRNPRRMNRHNKAVVRAFQSHFSRNQDSSDYGDPINYHDMLWSCGLLAKYTT